MSAQQESSLYARATHLGPSLPEALASVAAYLALHPDRVAVSSALELAAAIGTSDASVIRTAKALGYRGMKEMRQAAMEAVSGRTDPAAVLARRIHSTAGGSHLSQVLEDTERAVAQFRAIQDDVDWEGVVDIVADARRVFCYGLAPIGFIADYLAFFLARTGTDARSFSTTGVLLADDLQQFRVGDAVVLFAPIRQFDEIVAVVRTAREVGARVVLITEAIGMPIAAEVDQVLATSPTSLSAASDASIPLAIAQALVHAVAARRPQQATDALSRLNTLRTVVSHQKAPLIPERLGFPSLPDRKQE